MMKTGLSVADSQYQASTTLKREVSMKTLRHYPSFAKPITGKRLAICAILAALSFWSMPAAFADRDHGHDGRRSGEGRGGWHGGHRGYRGGYGYGGGYGYAQPVYVPPPVYAVPQQSPGVNLVVPLNLRF